MRAMTPDALVQLFALMEVTVDKKSLLARLKQLKSDPLEIAKIKEKKECMEEKYLKIYMMFFFFVLFCFEKSIIQWVIENL